MMARLEMACTGSALPSTGSFPGLRLSPPDLLGGRRRPCPRGGCGRQPATLRARALPRRSPRRAGGGSGRGAGGTEGVGGWVGWLGRLGEGARLDDAADAQVEAPEVLPRGATP